MSCHANKMFYSPRCVFCRTISLPSFTDLRHKLAQIALSIHMMLYWVESMTSSVISFAYFTHFSNLNTISPELMRVFANGKRHFHSFIEFYVIHLKNQKGKNLIIVAF